jgi:membrane protein DedA with SNARE-associated domain
VHYAAIVPDVNQLITDWGYTGIFLVVILGNIGLPVPEETVLAVAGYLVWSGRLRLLPVLIVGLVSAIVGDNFGYWLGRHYGRAAVERYGRRLLKPGRVVVAESFVRRYGALAVCVARFVGGFRFLAGPLAGAVGLPFASFLRGNLLGALLFVPYAVGIGYAIGYGLGPRVADVQHALGGIGRTVLILALVVVSGLVAWRTLTRIAWLGVIRVIRTRVRRRHDRARGPWE